MTPWTRLDRRARSAAAVLLAALAVVGSVLVGPAAASQVAGSGAVPGAAARGAAPAGVGLRDHRDVARPALRRGAREQSAPTTDSSVRTALGHGPAPVTGLLAVALLLIALIGVRTPAFGRVGACAPPYGCVPAGPGTAGARARLTSKRRTPPQPADRPARRPPRRTRLVRTSAPSPRACHVPWRHPCPHQ